MKHRGGTWLLAVAAMMAVAVSGCFTGVESTPRIGPPPKERPAGAGGDSLSRAIDAIRPLAPAQWRRGDPVLLVDDQRIARTLAPGTPAVPDLSGRSFRYLERRAAVSLMGSSATDIILGDIADTSLTITCRIPHPMSALDTMEVLEIPFTIDLGLVARADSLLRGRQLYISTPDWYDASGHVVAGLRHVPVRIDSVVPGSHLYPAAVYFTARTDAPSPEGSHFVYLSIGGVGTRSRGFGQIFSTTSPRQRYPGIDESAWTCIERSQVRPGMTQTECRLALGAPQNVQAIPTRTGTRQIWSYPTGTYLIFDDGLLSDFRR